MAPSETARDLAETFADIARSFRAEGSVQQTLEKVVNLAVDTVDACDHAGVTLIEAGKFRTPASSDEVPPSVDLIQYETGEGPCLDAIREKEIFQTDDLTQEQRWPSFAVSANEQTGVVSMLCFRLFVEADTIGALNMYSRKRAAFDDGDRAVGSIFASHAGVALSAAIERHQLTEALKSRDVIGQAKGILMERENVSADEAYEILRRSSQHLNLKLRELAKKVVESQADA